MYEIIDGMCFLAGIASFIICFTQNKPHYTPIPLVWFMIYPGIN